MADQTPPVNVGNVPAPGRQEPRGNLGDFLDELCADKTISRHVDPARAGTVVLCHLERHLSDATVDRLEERFPEGLSALLVECQRLPGSPSGGMRHEREAAFARGIAEELGIELGQAEQVIRAVFTAIRDRLSDDGVQAVAAQLPRDLADFWRRPA